MVDIFPLGDLPDPLVVNILQKTEPVSFVRLRRAAKWLDIVAEENRRYIEIPLWRIDIAMFQTCGVGVRHEKNFDEFNNPYYYISPKQIVIAVSKTAMHWQYLSLPDVYKQLSGFVFKQVLTGHRLLEHATVKMKPSILSSYMEFLQKFQWCTKSATSDNTSLEIFNIIKPKILKILDDSFRNIPKCVETIEIQKLYGNILPNILSISSHVTNFLVNPGVIARYEYCLPSFIRQIVSAFYKEELPVSYAQLKNVFFNDVTVIHIQQPDDTMAATKLLTHYLNGTPYEKSQIVPTHKFYHKYHGARNRKRVTIANVNLTSKEGKSGLLAVRTDVLYTAKGNFDLMQVSVYFWKDRQQHLPATREAYEMEGSGIQWP